jgi:pimeloyl-ACP methyl ester carboxylesterase
VRSLTLRRAVIGCGIFYTILCLIFFVAQRSLLFFPTHNLPISRLDPWVRDGVIVGYCREVPSPNTVWLMMHGNAGQASNRDYVLEHLSAHDALYVLEYPGYGARGGSPSRSSIDAAARQAYNDLRTMYPQTPVCVIGESIGSGPAAMLATLPQPPDKMVLITPFDSLYRVASRHYFFLPVRLLLLDRWDNVATLGDYPGEVHIYGAKADRVIPADHARSLAQACKNATVHLIPGGHNDWSRSDEVKITR